ncbi:adenosylhomocysteinase [Candidatus Woesearchaeota archaeon]|nr:adenosylhomocysteinase [Candidatus Woesearchaeota archaeon]
MDKGPNYEVKDIKLAEQGILNLEIAESRMQALMRVKERFSKEKPLNVTKAKPKRIITDILIM